MEQLSFDFIIPIERLKEQNSLISRRQKQRESWKLCWNWDGPKVGEPLEVGSTCVKRLGDDQKSYWYCAPCIAVKEIEPDVWLARVNYSEETCDWLKSLNDTLLVLDVEDIWAPVRYLTALREN